MPLDTFLLRPLPHSRRARREFLRTAGALVGVFACFIGVAAIIIR